MALKGLTLNPTLLNLRLCIRLGYLSRLGPDLAPPPRGLDYQRLLCTSVIPIERKTNKKIRISFIKDAINPSYQFYAHSRKQCKRTKWGGGGGGFYENTYNTYRKTKTHMETMELKCLSFFSFAKFNGSYLARIHGFRRHFLYHGNIQLPLKITNHSTSNKNPYNFPLLWVSIFLQFLHIRIKTLPQSCCND